jgi:uncharacterized protein YqhQ
MEQPARKTGFSLGGQALIEGVLMRSPHFVAAAVRRADGSIDTRVERFDSISAALEVVALPFLRGSVALVEMMILGMRYLNWSAQLAMMDSEALRLQKHLMAQCTKQRHRTRRVLARHGSAATPGVPSSTHMPDSRP